MGANVRPSRGDWVVVAACLGCQIGMGAGGYVLPVFLRPVVDDLHWSRTDYALSNPIMSTTVALVGPLVGWAADRRGPRAVLALGSVLMSAAFLLAGRMREPLDLYQVALVIGVAVACLGDLPTGAAVTARFHGARGLALGVVYIGSNIGGALVPLLATMLAAGASWRVGLTSIGGGLWIALLPLALAVGPPPRPPRAETVDPADSGAASPHAWRQALRGRDFWLLFWALFAFYLYRLGMNTHLVAFLGDLGYSNLEAASGFSVALALGIAGKLLAGTVADRVGPRAAAVGNFMLIAAASVLLLLPRVSGAIPVFLVVHGFATAAEDVVIPLVIARRFGVAHLGRIYGLLLLALVPGGIAGPILAARVFDLTGSYAGVFTLFVATNILAVLALAAVRTPR